MTVTKIDIPLEGRVIELGERTIHPLAKLHGWYGSAQAEIGGAGGWLQATPTEAIVHDETDTETHIPIQADETEPSIQKLVFIALAIAIVSEVIILLTLRRRSG